MAPALQAVIFDFDGVVVNSEIIALTELQLCLNDLGAEINEAEMIARFLGASLEKIAEYARQSVGPVDTEALRNSWYERLFDRYRHELTVMPQALDLFRTLEELGISYCIASGSSYRRLDFALSTTGLDDIFHGRAYSADSVLRGKPEPDVFLYAADKLGIAPANCLVVEDAIAGVQAAQKADMRAVGFVGGCHLQTCRHEHAENLKAAGAAATISSLMDVLNFIGTKPEDAAL